MENFKKLLYLTAFSCMACDGEIAKKEVELLNDMKESFFEGVETETLSEKWMALLKKDGKSFLRDYLNELSHNELSEDEELKILEVVVKTIYADEKIEYNEVKFFRSIRNRLNSTDDIILERIEGIEDFWLNADNNPTLADLDDDYFNKVNFEDLKIEK